MISSTYRSSVTTNTLMVVVGLKKNHVEKIMDYFVDFEEAFWRQNMYVLLRLMPANRDIFYYLYNHLDKK